MDKIICVTRTVQMNSTSSRVVFRAVKVALSNFVLCGYGKNPNPLVLMFMILWKVVAVTLDSVDKMLLWGDLSFSVANQKKSDKEQVSAVLFVKLCYVVLTFVSLGNIFCVTI